MKMRSTVDVKKSSDSWYCSSVSVHARRLLLSLCLPLLATGCVSTEQLYARYDQPDCGSATVIESSAVVVQATPAPWHWAILFPFNGSEITRAQEPLLQDNLAALQAHPEYRLLLRGYADSVASRHYNQALTERRVAAVTRWLTDQGIAPGRINGQGLGQHSYIRQPGHGVAEDANRRVEMLLLDGQGKPVAWQGQGSAVSVDGISGEATDGQRQSTLSGRDK